MTIYRGRDMFTYKKKIPTGFRGQVLVVGAGSAGATAAITAARAGADVLLIDRYGFLGGTSTAVLDTFYGFYTPGEVEKKVVGGIPDAVVDGLNAYRMCVKRPNTYGAGSGLTYNPEYLKVVWENLVRESGAKILLHAFVQDAVVEEGRVTAVLVATKAGLQWIAADLFIDASGDADVCHYAGFPYELAGEQAPAQSLTTTFKMCNVDLAKRKRVSKLTFHSLMAEAAESGEYCLPRREGSDHPTPVPSTTATVMTRLKSFEKREDKTINATDPELLSEAEVEGRRQAIEYVRFLRDKVPGYEKADLIGFGVQIGVRETRRVQGDYRLTREDVLRARQFEDQIGLCGAPIEDHHSGADTKWQYLPEGECVGIPYRALLPRGAANVLVAGRCFSATHDAHASVRSMGQCMAMGQAAGAAAAMSVQRKKSLREISPVALQDVLRKLGAVLETPATEKRGTL